MCEQAYHGKGSEQGADFARPRGENLIGQVVRSALQVTATHPRHERILAREDFLSGRHFNKAHWFQRSRTGGEGVGFLGRAK